MTKQETIELQIRLAELGFYDDEIDGIAGPKTMRAYEQYWQTRPVEQTIPIVTPAPATPWWTSRGIWGPLLVLVALPMKALFGVEYSPAEAVEVVMPVIEIIPDLLIGIGAIMAYFGRKNAKAPIDSTLLARFGGHAVRLGVRRYPLHPSGQSGQTDHFLGGTD